ncbi:hypothetical protein [Streptomyces sp. NPDC127084]|uniref:hypothetical protein n=1 Tax=Streptomyces sp. NPDC127084 TaxID=3347133 RepID=UPI00365A1CB1
MPTTSQITKTLAALTSASALANVSGGVIAAGLAYLVIKYAIPALFPNGIAGARRVWADSRRSDKVTDTACALADTDPATALEMLRILKDAPVVPAAVPAGPDTQRQTPDEPSEPPP